MIPKNKISFIDEKDTTINSTHLQPDEAMKYLRVVFQINGIREAQTKELIKVANKFSKYLASDNLFPY